MKAQSLSTPLYVATGFCVATVYAIQLLRGKRESYYRKGLVLAMALGAYESKL